MPKVTVALSADELDTLDAWALAEHGGDREAAMEALLDEWIDEQP
ncbi:MAG: hypothetical protein U5J98_08335 [Halobacteriales archaeon]|nr:hypothetical protein [Halobacteriales archaeon]